MSDCSYSHLEKAFEVVLEAAKIGAKVRIDVNHVLAECGLCMVVVGVGAVGIGFYEDGTFLDGNAPHLGGLTFEDVREELIRQARLEAGELPEEEERIRREKILFLNEAIEAKRASLELYTEDVSALERDIAKMLVEIEELEGGDE